MNTKFIIYTDRKKQTRWRAVRAGRTVADSGEAYRRAAICVRSLKAFIASCKLDRFDFDNQTKTSFEV